jgi:hypothetical protein
MSARICATADSHVAAAACSTPRATSSAPGAAASALAVRTNASCVSATETTGVKLRTTSATAVDTIGLPAAMYSSVLVGLMYSVASLSANGMRHTSNAFT